MFQKSWKFVAKFFGRLVCFSKNIDAILFVFSCQYLIFELSRWPSSPDLTTSQLLWTGFKMNKHLLNDNQIHMCYVAVSCFYFGVPCFTSHPIPKSLICIQAEFPARIFILIFFWSFSSTIGLIPLRLWLLGMERKITCGWGGSKRSNRYSLCANKLI